MIRNGAQRILQRLETAKLPLEPWMREVLLNCCYVEIRIEDFALEWVEHEAFELFFEPFRGLFEAFRATEGLEDVHFFDGGH